MAIHEMGFDEIGKALKLINDEGWGYTPPELERMLRLDPHGSYVYEADGHTRGILTTVTYGRTGVIGHLVVSKDSRRMKIGQTLMNKAFEYCEMQGCDSIILYATDEGAKLYHRLGFEPRREAFCAHSRLQEKDFAPNKNLCTPMLKKDLAEIVELDSDAFGDDRSKLLVSLFEEFPDLCWTLVRDGRIGGFAMGRRSPAGFDFGPWMCATGKEDAELLIRTVMRSFGRGEVYVGGFEGNHEAVSIIRTLEPIKSWRTQLMIKGKERYVQNIGRVFGISSFELG